MARRQTNSEGVWRYWEGNLENAARVYAAQGMDNNAIRDALQRFRGTLGQGVSVGLETARIGRAVASARTWANALELYGYPYDPTMAIERRDMRLRETLTSQYEFVVNVRLPYASKDGVTGHYMDRQVIIQSDTNLSFGQMQLRVEEAIANLREKFPRSEIPEWSEGTEYQVWLALCRNCR